MIENEKATAEWASAMLPLHSGKKITNCYNFQIGKCRLNLKIFNETLIELCQKKKKKELYKTICKSRSFLLKISGNVRDMKRQTYKSFLGTLYIV